MDPFGEAYNENIVSNADSLASYLLSKGDLTGLEIGNKYTVARNRTRVRMLEVSNQGRIIHSQFLKKIGTTLHFAQACIENLLETVFVANLNFNEKDRRQLEKKYTNVPNFASRNYCIGSLYAISNNQVMSLKGIKYYMCSQIIKNLKCTNCVPLT